MGCDIHLHVEKQNPLGEWEHIPDPEGANWNDHRAWYGSRNYHLFAILADVRNGYGFAGIETGTGFNPIDEPRGLPDDVSADIRKESDSWGSDGHSHSWLTVGEVLAYDWDQTTQLVREPEAVPYHACVNTDWWATVARAYRLSEGGPASVRFVFWFDN